MVNIAYLDASVTEVNSSLYRQHSTEATHAHNTSKACVPYIAFIQAIDPLQLHHKIGNFWISSYTDTPPLPSWCTTAVLAYGHLY